jgi:hypothetical protein
MSCGAPGDDVPRFERGGEDIEDEEPEVPGQDQYVDEETGGFVQEAHFVFAVARYVDLNVGKCVQDQLKR